MLSRARPGESEGPACAEAFRFAAIADYDFCREPQPRKIFADALRAHAVRVHCKQLAPGEFEQVSGFSARRRAGIEDPHPVAHIQKRRRPLGARVLH